MTELPAPLTPPDADLQDFPFMPLHVARLRDSDLAAEEHPEACWYAVMLWAASWHQIPAGSLPDSDAVLTRLVGLGRDAKTWKKHRAGALRGFIRCADDRLYHPVVAEQVIASWQGKLEQRHRTECARIKKANQRNGTDLAAPDFVTFLSSRHPASVPFLSLGTSVNVPEETPSKGQRQGQRQGDSNNNTSTPSPDTARDWSKLNDLLSITNELCDIAGVPRPTEQAKAAVQMDVVKAWLADGIDPEQDIVPAITAEIAKADGPSFSLKRFDASVRHAYRKRLAIAKDPKLAPPEPRKPAQPITFERDGESAEIAAFRRYIANAIGDGPYRAIFERASVDIGAESVTVRVEPGVLTIAHGDHAFTVEAAAKRVLGMPRASIEARLEAAA